MTHIAVYGADQDGGLVVSELSSGRVWRAAGNEELSWYYFGCGCYLESVGGICALSFWGFTCYLGSMLFGGVDDVWGCICYLGA